MISANSCIMVWTDGKESGELENSKADKGNYSRHIHKNMENNKERITTNNKIMYNV